MLELLLDNVSCEDYNISIAERPLIPTPQLRTDTYKVTGRHGSLTIVDAYDDMPITIKFNILEDIPIKPLVRRAKGFFMDKKELSFSDDKDFYYVIKIVNIGDIENEIRQHGEFEVEFWVEPFLYEKTPIVTLIDDGSINNPGTIEANPLITIYGEGDGSFTINDMKIETIGQIDTITLDCRLGIAYNYKGLNRSKYLRGGIPVLKVGDNPITFSGGVTKIEVDKKVRYL